MKENRQYRRVIRPLNIKFCISHENIIKWNRSSVIGDISAGGVKFIATCDLKNKEIKLEIESPRLVPRKLMIDAIVVDSQPSRLPSYFDIRAKFVNLSPEALKDLAILEKRQR